MTTWLGVLAALGCAVSLILLPGLIIGYAGGLRGLATWGLAPVLSATAVSVAGLAGPLVRVPLGPALIAGTTLCLAIAAAAVRKVLGEHLEHPDKDSPRVVAAALGGAALGGVPIVAALVLGIGRPERWPQTFDAVFHLSTVRMVLWTGDGSSLDIGRTSRPESTHAFYPGAWHDLAALVVQLSNAPIAVGVTALSIAMAAVAWPLGCVFAVRVICGAKPGPVLAAGILSGGFGAAPYLLLSYGTLWPNALGTVLLPALLGTLATVLGVVRDSALGRREAAVVGAAAMPGCVLAHPNVATTVMVYGSVMGLFAAARWASEAEPRLRRRRQVGAGLSLLGLAVGEAWLVVESPLFAMTRATNWPARGTVAQAMGEYLFSAPVRTPLPAALAALTVVGIGSAVRRPQLYWLAASHLATGALYVAARASDTALAQALTGPWYNDAFRLGALAPVTGIPLAVLGLSALVARSRQVWPARPAAHWLASLALLTLATQGFSIRDNARVVATWYRSTDLLGASESDLMQRLPQLVPAGSVIAGNPWNGSALVQPLADRPVLFPHVTGTWGKDRALLASSLNQAARDPDVCAAVRRLHVGYVLDGPVAFWPGDRRQQQYPGLEVSGQPGFPLVAAGGRLTLHRVAAC